jgi:FMN phosphatase YigB (HAD superfamily)/carbamoylphosphate synthase large subunit
MRNLNVLVVSGGSFQGLTLIKGLRYSYSIRIIMCDSSIENISKYFVDSFHVVPEVNKKEKFIDSLLNICVKENIKLIFPSTDIELLPLSESLKLFKKKNIHIAVSDPDFLKLARNKHILYGLLIKEGFPTLPVLDIAELNLKFPIIGKPLYSWGSRGIILLNSRDEMSKYNMIELKTNYVWQPCLKEFEEYSIDCAINFNGKISDFVIRKRLKTLGGFAVISEYVHDPEIEESIDKLLNCISSKGARGIFNIQILKKGSNYFFSDVNPRIGTSAVFSYKLGINFPLFLCSYINNEVYPRSQNNFKSKKIKMVRYLEELWIQKENSDNIKGIVFDLDDTLINQKQWIMDKLEILWSQFRKTLPKKIEFLLTAAQIIEEGNRSKVFDNLASEFKLSYSFKEKLINIYRDIKPKKCPLFPDVLPTIRELKKMNLKLALLTDNPPKSQKQKIRICNLEELFDVIVYSRELSQEKPNKALFKEVSNLLKIPEKSLIMVGDNLYKDILGSLKSNYKSAYWIVREGTFFNFEQRIFDKLIINKYNINKINDLRHLLWSLK